MGRHEIEKTAQGGVTRRAAFSDPANRHADDRAADHGQIEGRGPVAHAAAVFPGDHIQAQMQAGFDAPMAEVGLQHLAGAEHAGGEGAEEMLGFDLGGGKLVAVNTTGQPGGLLHKRESDGGAAGGEGPEGAGLGAAALAFTGLDQGRRRGRGKNRATDLGKVVARFPECLFGCP